VTGTPSRVAGLFSSCSERPSQTRWSCSASRYRSNCSGCVPRRTCLPHASSPSGSRSVRFVGRSSASRCPARRPKTETVLRSTKPRCCSGAEAGTGCLLVASGTASSGLCSRLRAHRTGTVGFECHRQLLTLNGRSVSKAQSKRSLSLPALSSLVLLNSHFSSFEWLICKFRFSLIQLQILSQIGDQFYSW